MNDEKRMKSVINQLKEYGVSDIRFSGSGNGNISLDNYETVLDTVMDLETEFGSLDELDKKMDIINKED